MLNSALDFTESMLSLRRTGRVVIENAFAAEAAEALYQALRTSVHFNLMLRDALGQRAMKNVPGDVYAQALSSAQQHGAENFAFAYEGYNLIDAYLSQDSEHNAAAVLRELVQTLNSADFLNFARRLTGDREIRRIDAQATNYGAGHFLLRHNDFSTKQDRRFAYVINLSKHWRADWGGVLQFFDTPTHTTSAQIAAMQPKIIDSVCPAFNTLTVFQVPQWHCVSPVAAFVKRSELGGMRLAITGWMQV